LSNTISYVRLFAVGVVGVKIAELGNEKFFEPAAHAIEHIGHDPITIIVSLLTIVLFVILWIAVQIFALGLGLFSPNVQAARLHFVEWMGKFYEVGGVMFNPFGHKQNYVEVE
jgi:vacuolar-type H+-ATPase subunit I/STV1